MTAAREVAGEHKVHAIFQPHLYSRTREFAAEFAAALEIADRAYVLDVFGAREEPLPGVTGHSIAELAVSGRVTSTPHVEEAIGAVVQLAGAGDLILTIGAGDVTALGPRIVNGLALN